jgi:hypothetical protein
MRGLDPRIHQKNKSCSSMMDCRVKPGNDNGWAAYRDRHFHLSSNCHGCFDLDRRHPMVSDVSRLMFSRVEQYRGSKDEGGDFYRTRPDRAG